MREATRAEIKRRTPPEWYGLATPAGWDDLVEDTFLSVLNICPDLEVHQIKEKFGTLVFHSNVYRLNNTRAAAIISEAERRSAKICQSCGYEGNEVSFPANLRSGERTATLCPKCRVEGLDGYEHCWP